MTWPDLLGTYCSDVSDQGLCFGDIVTWLSVQCHCPEISPDHRKALLRVPGDCITDDVWCLITFSGVAVDVANLASQDCTDENKPHCAQCNFQNVLGVYKGLWSICYSRIERDLCNGDYKHECNCGQLVPEWRRNEADLVLGSEGDGHLGAGNLPTDLDLRLDNNGQHPQQLQPGSNNGPGALPASLEPVPNLNHAEKFAAIPAQPPEQENFGGDKLAALGDPLQDSDLFGEMNGQPIR